MGDKTCEVPNSVIDTIRKCSGDVGAGEKLFNYWEENNCPGAYSQALNTGKDCSLSYNKENQEMVQDEVVKLFNTYFETNSLTDDVTSTQFDNFQDTLIALCIDPTLPGVCNKFLNNYCSNYTRLEVSNSPTLINFCGCYVPPDPTYLQYTLGSPECIEGASGCTAGCTAGNTGCTGQPACDPLCHRAMTSQKANIDTGNIITCPESICVIDDVVINAINTQVQGGVNFNTVCPGCIDGCLCIVSGENVSSTMSNIGVGTNFNELCGNNSICIVEDAGGNILSESSCTGIDPLNTGISITSYLPNLGLIFIILFVLLLIFFIALAARFATQKVDRPGILIELHDPNPKYTASYQIPSAYSSSR